VIKKRKEVIGITHFAWLFFFLCNLKF